MTSLSQCQTSQSHSPAARAGSIQKLDNDHKCSIHGIHVPWGGGFLYGKMVGVLVISFRFEIPIFGIS